MRSLARRALLTAALAASLAGCGKGGAGGAASSASEMSMGNASAPVTVVEYASTTCSHCARFNQDIFPGFKKKYIDSGHVHYVFREFLTPPAEVAAAGFLVARCAGADKYFTVIDSLFRTQGTLFETQDPRAWIYNTAKSAGMSDDKVKACVENPDSLKALNERVQTAIDKDKVSGTPTFLFNGKKFDGQVVAGQTYAGGELTMAQLDAILGPMLAKK